MGVDTQSKPKLVDNFKVGHAYENVGGFGATGGLKRYLVFENHTMMVNMDSKIIVKHDRGTMERLTNNGDTFKEISVQLFKDSLREMIFDMELYEFVKSKS